MPGSLSARRAGTSVLHSSHGMDVLLGLASGCHRQRSFLLGRRCASGPGLRRNRSGNSNLLPRTYRAVARPSNGPHRRLHRAGPSGPSTLRWTLRCRRQDSLTKGGPTDRWFPGEDEPLPPFSATPRLRPVPAGAGITDPSRSRPVLPLPAEHSREEEPAMAGLHQASAPPRTPTRPTRLPTLSDRTASLLPPAWRRRRGFLARPGARETDDATRRRPRTPPPGTAPGPASASRPPAPAAPHLHAGLLGLVPRLRRTAAPAARPQNRAIAASAHCPAC